MRNFIYPLLVLLTVLTACQPSGKQKLSTNEGTTESVPQNDTLKIYHAYLKVKDALVESDKNAAKEAAANLSSGLEKIKGCTEAAGLAKQISVTGDVKSQRVVFVQLSQDIIPLVKGIKSKPQPVYIEYCPMANDGKGGYWLSAQKEIKNPYYGSEMMECGEVTEELK